MADKTRAVEVDPEDCTFCNRPKTTVMCGNCYYRVEPVRARKECKDHPNNFFSVDLKCCPIPSCRSTDLREKGIDQRPVKLPTRRDGSSNSPLSTTDSASSPIAAKINQQEPELAMELLSRKLEQTRFERDVPKRNRRRKTQVFIDPKRCPLPGINKTRTVDLMDFSSTSQEGIEIEKGAKSLPNVNVKQPSRDGPPGNDCVCNRRVECIFCDDCGYYRGGNDARKYLACNIHPEQREGLTKCPGCGGSADSLHERTF